VFYFIFSNDNGTDDMKAQRGKERRRGLKSSNTWILRGEG